jgi:cytochrome b pre-mRNA-processing protein 3
MSFFDRLFGKAKHDPKPALLPLYASIVAQARQTHWYDQGRVPDTVDGRFEILATILTLVLLRLENEPDQAENSTLLTEIFIEDMDGQLREIGIGDMIVGKHIGKMMSALGGRLGAYRDAFAMPAQLDNVIIRNIYSGDDGADDDYPGLVHVRDALVAFQRRLSGLSIADVLGGTL